MSKYGDVEQTMVPGTLRGYREWTPRPDGLQAVNFPFIWKPGVNTAQCAGFGGGGVHEVPVHEAPVRDCTCGFYARHMPAYSSPFSIAGVIKASGRVILGTTGFRAQYAEIEALYSRWDASTMLDRYNVPIYRDFDAMVRDFPPISVQHLLPEPDTLVNWQLPPITRGSWIGPARGTWQRHGHWGLNLLNRLGWLWEFVDEAERRHDAASNENN